MRPSIRRQRALDIRVQTVSLVLLTIVATGFALAQLGPILVPFVMALLLTYCLKPLTEWQAQWLRLPRSLATAGTIVVGLGVLFVVGIIGTRGATTLASKIGPYRDQFQQLLERAAEALPLERFGLQPDLRRGIFAMPDQVAQSFLTNVLSETTYLLSNGTLIFVFMLFMIIGTHRPPTARPQFLVEVETGVQRYLLVFVVISVITGLLVGGTLYWIGVPFAVFFGFLAFLLNFIPTIGSIVATLLPVPVLLLSPELSTEARVLGFAVPGVIQFIIGNFVAPHVQGSTLHLHPIVVVMAIIFFSMIWGIAGAFLATPLTAIAKIACERSTTLRPAIYLFEGDVARFVAEVSGEG